MDTLQQLKLICQTYGIWPDRTKGQNFLINKNVISKIVNTADLIGDETILEIGPGLGILTEALVNRAAKVVSVELDSKIFEFLKAKFVNQNNLELINSNILNLSSAQLKLKQYKIVANIPYNITSHFLRQFLTDANPPEQMILLMQKEVAERICAKPSAMSLLAVSVQLYGQPKIVQLVSKENFWPKPAVDSAIIKIDKIKNHSKVDKFFSGLPESFFWRIVKIGFSAKRKQLHNNLTAGLRCDSQTIKKALNEANLDQKVRAQNLSIPDWVKLAKKVNFYLN